MTHDTLGDLRSVLANLSPAAYVKLSLQGNVSQAEVWDGEKLRAAAVGNGIEEAIDRAIERATR